MGQDETRTIAIAYAWHLTSASWTEYDLALTLARADSTQKSGAPVVTTYHSKLPASPPPGDGCDVSGTLGLIDPVPDDYPERPRAASAERLLANLVLAEMAKLEFNPNAPLRVLLQGPLIPKLRGRLLYRGVASATSIWAITWNAEWTNRIAKACGVQLGVGMSEMLPAEVLDRSTRAWFNNGRHWELLTDPWDCLTTAVADRKAEITDDLPSILSAAHKAAAERTRIERMFTEFYPQRDSRSVPFVQKIKSLLEPRHPQAELFAATQPVIWEQPKSVYNAFCGKQDDLLKEFQPEA